MKKILSLLFAITVSVGILYAEIYSGRFGIDGDNLTWAVNTEDSTLTISGIGGAPGYYWASYVPWNDYRNYIKNVSLPNGLTNIPDFAFSSCPITNITIPENVIGIGSYAFCGCVGLTSIAIPENVQYIGSDAFNSCSSLKTVTLPSNLTDLGLRTFQECHSLENIVIPPSVKSIYQGTFGDCFSLTSVTIPDSVSYISEDAFLKVPNIVYHGYATGAPWGARKLNGYLEGYLVFNDETKDTLLACSAAASGDIILPDGVNHVATEAMYMCKSITSVTFPSSINSIWYYALVGCENLQSITCLATTPPELSRVVFHSTDMPLYVPMQSVVKYKNLTCPKYYGYTCWGDFKYIWGITSPENGSSCEKAIYFDKETGQTQYGKNDVWYYTDLYGIEIDTYAKITVSNLTNDTNTIELSCIAAYPSSCDDGNTLFTKTIKLIPFGSDSVSIFYDEIYDKSWVVYLQCNSQKDCHIDIEYVTVEPINPNKYSISFCNWDGTELQTSQVIEGTIPVYLGNTPLRPKDGQYKYTFIGWTPDVIAAISDATYTATYSAIEYTPNPITIRLDPQSCADWSVVRLWAWTSNGNLFDAWPGIVVSPDADGWYSYTFDESVESVNIIWTDGTNQTVNIEGVTASTCYALNSTSGKTITASVVDCGSTASNYYTIRFLNWDGTVLQNSQVKEGELPSYTGTTPVRPADEQYTYSFSGWSPAIATATADADYTAQFTATEKTTDPSIPTVQDLATAGYDVANKVVLCLYFDDAPCYDVVIAGTYMADEAGSWITDPEQLVHMAALESFEGWYAAEIPYSSNAQGKPIQLKSNGAFSWEYQSGDADAWIKRGGEGSQTAAIVAGYNNEADVYYPAPGCYIYELAYWKNHNNPCVIIPTHNYTIHLYAPDACEEMKPAIIGNFNNWTTGVAMSETTDEQGKKMYTITIASDEGLMFKFRDAAYDNWSNELQEFLEGYRVWSTFSNFMIPAATQDTTIVYDFSDNDKYRFKLCEKVEDVVVWLKVPAGAPGYYNGAIEMVVYSTDEPTAMPLQYNQEDELWSVELQAKGSNYFFVREANSEGNYILNYTHYYYSDGSDEYVWSTWGTTFQYYWEDGTGDFTGSKIIMLDISNPSYYKWDVPAIGTGIEDVLSDQVQCTKVLRNGQIYIIRGDKTYTLQGQEVK